MIAQRDNAIVVLAARDVLVIEAAELANLTHVREIVPWFNSRYRLRMSGDTDVEVSKMYAKQLRVRLGI